MVTTFDTINTGLLSVCALKGNMGGGQVVAGVVGGHLEPYNTSLVALLKELAMWPL